MAREFGDDCGDEAPVACVENTAQREAGMWAAPLRTGAAGGIAGYAEDYPSSWAGAVVDDAAAGGYPSSSVVAVADVEAAASGAAVVAVAVQRRSKIY